MQSFSTHQQGSVRQEVVVAHASLCRMLSAMCANMSCSARFACIRVKSQMRGFALSLKALMYAFAQCSQKQAGLVWRIF